jgi:ABC-type glycerol-3-phosphate transport system substrate-binding protein
MPARKLLFLLLAYMACSGLPGSNTSKPKEIEVVMFLGGEGSDYFLQAARKYEALRPDIKVNLWCHPRAADKVMMRILEGKPPEVIWGLPLPHRMFLERGLYMPLNKHLNEEPWGRDGMWRDTFMKGTFDKYTRKGMTYGIPYSYHTWLIWYNKRIFSDNGYAPPDTWEDLIALCEDIKKTGIAPFAYQGRYPMYAVRSFYDIYQRINGTGELNELMNYVPGKFSTPGGRKAADLLHDLSSKYFQEGCLGMDHTEAQMQFFKGKTAMIACGTWLHSEMSSMIPPDFELGCFPIPKFAGGEKCGYDLNIMVSHFFVFKDSARPLDAVEFIKFITSLDETLEFTRQTKVLTSVAIPADTWPLAGFDDLRKVISECENSYSEQLADLHPEWDQFSTDAFGRLVSGRITPDAFSQMCDNFVLKMTSQDADRHAKYVLQPVLLGIFVMAGAVLLCFKRNKVQ